MKYCFLFFLLVVSHGFAQSKDCSNFKTGTFKYVNSSAQNTIIVRNDSTQIETDTDNGFELTGSIKWLSDCKYKLTYISVSNPDYKSILGMTFNVDITSIEKNTYKYSAYNESRKITGELVKMK